MAQLLKSPYAKPAILGAVVLGALYLALRSGSAKDEKDIYVGNRVTGAHPQRPNPKERRAGVTQQAKPHPVKKETETKPPKPEPRLPEKPLQRQDRPDLQNRITDPVGSFVGVSPAKLKELLNGAADATARAKLRKMNPTVAPPPPRPDKGMLHPPPSPKNKKLPKKKDDKPAFGFFDPGGFIAGGGPFGLGEQRKEDKWVKGHLNPPGLGLSFGKVFM